MMISILGPDGTGKTTLASKISENTSIDYIYFGNNIESRKYKYFSDFIKSQPQGKINTFLKYIAIFINDYHYFKLAKKNHLISDRSPIDKYIGTKIYNMKYRNWYHYVTLKIFPKPDLIILLVGDAEVIYHRKKEIPVSVIKKNIQYYEKYLIKNNINYFVIDTVVNNEKSTYDIAINEINDLLNG